ncbi:uncharacterized protein BT62DRAFT_975636 [Guyanagaster necrorhizus]|uniref:Uncharacterized protein n=1 Tax=Guyanagaster necrorhizus TaxID=856835 RepID=A0A9P8ANA7_9AGAR|nr:uncharacterized protein BT62DRAFT_975636 [Guyanagaster necrorhizus MCA 3950]KAG7440707.1 hypothetical protein BT62DRAFT_975636 [Guyanagaster necrorhizus MCA 3950]
MSYRILTLSEVLETTKETVRVLSTLGFKCCLVGSVACSCYGMRRSPNDIDMVVLGCRLTQEELKRRVVAANSSFYLVASKDPRATYKVLWYRLPGYRRSCKVDLLFPGIMNIPPVPSDSIVHRRHSYNHHTFPVMPFIPLLLLKLQAWKDHGESTKYYMNAKQPTDVRDITELLNIYVTAGNLGELGNWVPESFLKAGRSRRREFVRLYPHTANNWRRIKQRHEEAQK